MKIIFSEILRVLLVFMFVFNIMPTEVLAEKSAKTVRVGYLYLPGFQEEDKNGNRSGYGYEILQGIGRYTNWKYDYKGYKDTWTSMKDKLAKGDIDIIVFANKDSDSEKVYDFSTEKIGDSGAVLLTKDDNTKLVPNEFPIFKDIKVGVLKENTKNLDFDLLAQKNNFTYKTTYYNTLSELISALKNDSVDAIVVSSNCKIAGVKILAKTNPTPFYLAVKKGNIELLKEANSAIEALKKDSPNFINEFSQNAIIQGKNNKIEFTNSEKNYLDEQKKSGKEIRALLKPNFAPLSYFDHDGHPQGMIYTIAKEIEKRTGLKFNYIQTHSYEEYQEKMLSADVDVILETIVQNSFAEQRGLKLTDSYLKLPFAELSLKNNKKRETVAVLAGNSATLDYAHKNYKIENVIVLNSPEQAVQAVLDEKVDSTIGNLYVINAAVNNDQTNKLIATPIIGLQAAVCLGVRNTQDKNLITILNKTVKSLDKEYLQGVLIAGLQTEALPFTIKGYLYNNPMIALGGLAGIFFLILFMVLHIYNIKRLRMEKEQKDELAKFISYLCTCYLTVEEIDLDKQIVNEYSLQDGEVVIETRAIRSTEEVLKNAHPDDMKNFTLDNMLANLERIVKTCTQAETFVREKGDDGEWHWMSYFAQGIRSDDQYHRICLVLKKDVSEIKLKEIERTQQLKDALIVAEKSSKVRGEFLSRVSHEIRTPLNAIISYLSISKEENNLKYIKQCIDNSTVAAKHLLDLVNDILDTNAIENGEMKLSAQEFDLKETIISSYNLVSGEAEEKGVILETIVDGVEEEKVVGDPLRLKQVLLNILSNAIKFTPTGGRVYFSIKQVMVKDAKVFMNFEVTDTGIGMGEEFKEKAFVPFEQENGSSSYYGGTGLGLSIVNNIVNMQHGAVSVESEEGKGTTVNVSLPFGYAAKTSEELERKNFNSIKVLVVDNEPKVANAVADFLRKMSVTVETAFDADTVITKVKEAMLQGQDFDLCIISAKDLEKRSCFDLIDEINKVARINYAVTTTTSNYHATMQKAEEYNNVLRVIKKPIFKTTLEEVLLCDFKNNISDKENSNEGNVEYDFSGKRFLLVEDNKINADIVIVLLNKVHAEVDWVQDGHSACEKFGESEIGYYSAILMDIMMPEMDGYETTKHIRMSDRSDSTTIPIIAITANVFPEDVSKALSSGMNGHISKPVNKFVMYKEIKEKIM